MPRDGSKARARLREAALELYLERGYDLTTTAHIAARAGVTERTYFRHFADKREVLFDGESQLTDILVSAVASAPPGLAPFRVLVQALTAAVPLLIANRPIAEQRGRVIAVTPALQERAYSKIAALTDSLTLALTQRGTAPPTARLAAQVAMAAFDRASRHWADNPTTNLSAAIAGAANEIRELGTA